MPINIYQRTDEGQENEEVACLCDDEWGLAEQVSSLCYWLAETGVDLILGDYVADIGFCARDEFDDRFGGGASLSVESMKIMVEKGIHLYLSECPNDDKMLEYAEEGRF